MAAGRQASARRPVRGAACAVSPRSGTHRRGTGRDRETGQRQVCRRFCRARWPDAQISSLFAQKALSYFPLPALRPINVLIGSHAQASVRAVTVNSRSRKSQADFIMYEMVGEQADRFAAVECMLQLRDDSLNQ